MLQDPEVAAALQDVSVNPANFVKYQNNPKIAAVIEKLQTKLGKSGTSFSDFPYGMSIHVFNFIILIFVLFYVLMIFACLCPIYSTILTNIIRVNHTYRRRIKLRQSCFNHILSHLADSTPTHAYGRRRGR